MVSAGCGIKHTSFLAQMVLIHTWVLYTALCLGLMYNLPCCPDCAYLYPLLPGSSLLSWVWVVSHHQGCNWTFSAAVLFFWAIQDGEVSHRTSKKQLILSKSMKTLSISLSIHPSLYLTCYLPASLPNHPSIISRRESKCFSWEAKWCVFSLTAFTKIMTTKLYSHIHVV